MYYSADLMRLIGITAGCNAGPPPEFCKDQVLTRGEMAVFIVRSLYWSLSGNPENFTYRTSPVLYPGVSGGLKESHFGQFF